jgi:DNA polymerase (family X)
MPNTNHEVADALQEYSDLLAIAGVDPFKARAYEKAARSVAGYHRDVGSLDAEGILEIPNVGRSIAEKISELVETGTFASLEELRVEFPPGVRALMGVPTLGPKKAQLLHDELGITTVEELLDALHDHRLRDLRGFGEKTEERLLRGIQAMQRSGGRVQIGAAMDIAEELLGLLGEVPEVHRATYAGSLRRMRDTIGDIDLLAASEEPVAVMDAFASFPYAREVLAKGETKTSILTTKGLQVDLRVVRPEVWGAALQYFTGSKAHNVRVREIAVRRGLKLSEYGLFHAETEELIVAETEEEVYEQLGMAWIPPTLREDRGEVAAAQAGELPALLEVGDIQGDLHTHTDLTDGVAPLERMVKAAKAAGYRYYAITDHAELLHMQRMTREKALAQRVQIRDLEAEAGIPLLHGSELNIQPDGSVDWDEEFLSGFDVLVASVHGQFTMPREEMTRRLIRAMEHPYVHVIGHPSARIIGKRPAIEFDEEEVFKAAARTGTALEINSYPDRLDLRDEHVYMARRHGAKFAVDTDSHAPGHLANLRFGVGTAQRGWLTKDDVINAWPLDRLRAFLRKGR